MGVLLQGNFKHNFSGNRLYALSQNYKRWDEFFRISKENMLEKLIFSNGGSPGKGFIDLLFVQKRRSSFKLIKGER